jgi:hypothetical protein
VRLAYKDPFTRKPVEIIAPTKYFLKDYGFSPGKADSPYAADGPHLVFGEKP